MRVFLSAAIVLLAARASIAGPPVQVLVDTASPAYTVLTALDAADATALRRQLDGTGAQQLLDLAEFRRRARTLLEARVMADADPADDAIAQLLALVEREPGVPLGLTFDGGIAITATDYRLAERRLAERRQASARPR